MADELRLQASVTDNFSKPLKEMRDQIKKVQDSDKTPAMAANFEKLGSASQSAARGVRDGLGAAVTGLGLGVVSVTGSIAAMTAALRSFGAGTADLAAVSRETGIAVNTFRLFSGVAGEFRISSDVMSSGLQRFAHQMEDVRRGVSPLINEMQNLGPAGSDLIAKLRAAPDKDTAWDIFSQFLASEKHPEIRGRIAEMWTGSFDIGRLGSLGAEALRKAEQEALKRLGKLSPDDVARGEAVETAINNLKNSIGNLKDTLGADLAPGFTKLVDDIDHFIQQNKEGISDGVSKAIHEVGTALMETDWSAVGTSIKAVAQGFVDLANAMHALNQMRHGDFSSIGVGTGEGQLFHFDPTAQEQLRAQQKRKQDAEDWLKQHAGESGPVVDRMRKGIPEIDAEIRRLEDQVMQRVPKVIPGFDAFEKLRKGQAAGLGAGPDLPLGDVSSLPERMRLLDQQMGDAGGASESGGSSLKGLRREMLRREREDLERELQNKLNGSPIIKSSFGSGVGAFSFAEKMEQAVRSGVVQGLQDFANGAQLRQQSKGGGFRQTNFVPGGGGASGGGGGGQGGGKKPWFASKLPPEVTGGAEKMMGGARTGASDSNAFYDAIMKAEGTAKGPAYMAGNPYNAVLGHGKYGLPDKPITEMSIPEVLKFGDQVRHAHGASSALGAFQIVGKNIRTALREGLVSPDDKFDMQTQRKLASWLMRQPNGTWNWEGFKYHPDQRARAQEAFRRGEDRQFNSPAPTAIGERPTDPKPGPGEYVRYDLNGRPVGIEKYDSNQSIRIPEAGSLMRDSKEAGALGSTDTSRGHLTVSFQGMPRGTKIDHDLTSMFREVSVARGYNMADRDLPQSSLA